MVRDRSQLSRKGADGEGKEIGRETETDRRREKRKTER